MKLCAHCNAQFEDTYRRCLHCNRRLREPPPARPAASAVLLARREPIFARPLLDALAEAGIAFEVVAVDGAANADPLHGSSGRTARVEIYVDPEELEPARQIETRELAGALPDLPEGYGPADTTGDECPACGRRVRPTDTRCPDCGLAFVDGEFDGNG